jgi:hypothetical protein
MDHMDYLSYSDFFENEKHKATFRESESDFQRRLLLEIRFQRREQWFNSLVDQAMEALAKFTKARKDQGEFNPLLDQNTYRSFKPWLNPYC